MQAKRRQRKPAQSSTVTLKRAYDAPGASDGYRVLVDRLWPHGVTKRAARIDLWLKGIAPSAALRKWFGHDPTKWETFGARYRAELDKNPQAVEELVRLARPPASHHARLRRARRRTQSCNRAEDVPG